MSNQQTNLNAAAWEKLFDKYDILNQIENNGKFEISSSQIKEFREPRLMAKFDHKINLPGIFTDNNLAILPITRGDYVISHFDAYHNFESAESNIIKVSIPSYIQSLNINNISSETIALNCALASGIAADFLEDEELASTVSGRMGSGKFDFNINDSSTSSLHHISVNNSQIEIDAALEGIKSLSIFEAKRDLSDDFLIRQLYYPYRTWKDRVAKVVRPLFLVYSNGIYRLYEYTFEDPDCYNSLVLVKQKNYSIEDTRIEDTDIEDVLNSVTAIREPNVPFPQADRFERVINLCELLSEQELSRNDVTELYAFDSRQTNYYTDAARYLGLIDKRGINGKPNYRLTESGKAILSFPYKQRQLAFCRCILQHEVFAEALRQYFRTGHIPSSDNIIQIMMKSKLHKIESDTTFRRRSSTVRGWLNWIIGLISG